MAEPLTVGALAAALTKEQVRALWRVNIDLLHDTEPRERDLRKLEAAPAGAALLAHIMGDDPPPIALNEPLLLQRPWARTTIKVFRSRESWERAARAGIVILDWPACAAALLEWPEIVAEDLALGEEIERALRRAVQRATPAMPTIGVAT